MALRFFMFLFCMFTPFGAVAGLNATEFDKDTIVAGVQSLIKAQDVEAIEAHFAHHQARFEARELSADEMRALYEPFIWANLENGSFADIWLTEMPDSPFAKVALAWYLHKFSWGLRGEERARDTYPEAMATFSHMQREVWRLASTAHASAPRLIPASDAMFVVSTTTRQIGAVKDLITSVMKTDPNSGSLERAVDAHRSGWGGKYADAAALCDQYAARHWDAPVEPVLTCKITSSYWFDEQREWVEERLAKGDLPHLNFRRLHFLLKEEATKEEAELALEILSDPETVEPVKASWFDAAFGSKYGFPRLSPVHHIREYEQRKEELKNNPFSPKALFKMIEPELAIKTNANGDISYKVVGRPDLKTLVDYAERLVFAAPYDPETWKNYVVTMIRSNPEMPFSEMEPYNINAIITSNHDIQELLIYMQNKVTLYDIFDRIKVGGLPKELGKAFEGASLEHDILCPFMRALAVYRGICEVKSDYRCDPAPEVKDTFVVLENAGKRRGICRKERTLPAQSLAYSTMKFPETAFTN